MRTQSYFTKILVKYPYLPLWPASRRLRDSESRRVKFLPAGRQGYTRLNEKNFVYILKSLKNGSFYKGITTDLETRLTQHNKGLTSGNKAMKPFELVYVQICESTIEARTLEKYLKSGTGREIIQELI